ncbi:MAG: biliverdin-producing heme oxygenase [Trueperaceae bacterium]|nr:biliverdin-producing heme oxygenase [Trueperaceae bacterium]
MEERVFAVHSTLKALDDASAASAQPDGDATAAPDLRAVLRLATAELHRYLDRAPDHRALLAPDITLQRYTTIMAKHHHALTISEATLVSLEHAHPSYLPPYRRRLPALDADLATLGTPGRSTIQPGASDVPSAEPATAMDPSVARGRYLGTRYVLEGSTQGAAFIARRLEEHLPALSANAFAYWRVQAEEAIAWQAFARSLASLPARGELASAAIAAARDTFGAFLRAFGVDAPEASLPPEPEGPRVRAPR